MSSSSSDDPSGQSDSSVSQLLSVLIPTGVSFVIFMAIFIALRKKQKRVYEPRSTVESVPRDLQPTESPPGALSWIFSLLHQKESFIIQYTGVDGYFFLRFLIEFAAILFLGAIVTWVILFPINASNGNHSQGLNILSYANVKDKWRFLAHIFVSWVFFGSVVFLIYRELVYYTTFRHVVQTTPLYDSLLSSRVLLLTELPENLLDEDNLRSYFPPATSVWYARDYSKLQDDVKERTKLAGKYEGALNKVVTKAVKIRSKAIKKNKPVPEPEDDLNKYLKDGKKRPTHRLKFLIGKKVDTLNYGVERIGELNVSIKKQQEEHETNKQVPAVIIEFPNQLELQKAYQAIPYNKELKGVRRYNGLSPEDIIWENLSLTRTKRWIKKFIASTILTLMIIFWCIPVAVVGAISNINFLTDKVHFLKFINNMPPVLMGIITSLLPVVALAVLMSLVPPFIKKMGKIAGCITVQEVESYCQSWYYAFQVVNSFLVVTLTSAAAGSVTAIIADPTSALSLLASKLPKASNFYISFFCLQGLSVPSGLLLQLVTLILAQFLGKLLDGTPRAKWTRWNTLGQPFWSTTYPAYQLLAVIALCYAIIAPLLLAFATITFFLLYIAYAYTLVYVLKPNDCDSRGRNYPRALLQLFVGVYLAEICLIAMFVFGKNWVAVALEAVILVVSVAVHLYLKWKLLPLWDIVPISAIRYSAGDLNSNYPMYDQGYKEMKDEGINYWEGGNELDMRSSHILHSLPAGARHDEKNSSSDMSDKHSPFDNASVIEDGPRVSSAIAAPGKGVSWLTRFFRPKAESYELIRSNMPVAYNNIIQYDPAFLKTAYDNPAVVDSEPHIWVARDEMGLSEIEKNKALENGVDVSNENTSFNEKGSITFDGPPPSYEESTRKLDQKGAGGFGSADFGEVYFT
ncbi:uncharacterized protein RJT20DRAFT_93881 [Scheffersomyces xylosifermentans]|uniref:uncharacterized protein n=1 Tax=Scheffersomyces xylosifermentans TaxID=1304137 RepID=UPI00315DDA55